MAKVISPIQFSGTIGDLVFYIIDGQCYVRQKTSLDKDRFYKDPAYAGLPMMRVKNFGRASRLVSEVYRMLPKAMKNKKLFNQMTALAHALLWNENDPQDVKEALEVHFELKQKATELSERKYQPTAVQDVKVTVPAIEQPEVLERVLAETPIKDESKCEASNDWVSDGPTVWEAGKQIELSEWRVSDGGVLYQLPVNRTWLPYYEGQQQRIERGSMFPGWDALGWHPN